MQIAKNKLYDLGVVGAGWAAASVIYNFIMGQKNTNLLKAKKISILVFEKRDDLWRGVPYGNLGQTDFFLIETLRQAPFVPFEHWLLENRERIQYLVDLDKPTVKKWYVENRDKIFEGEILDIYFPRQLFGCFVQQAIKKLIEEKSSWLEINVKHEEVVNINYLDDQSYLVFTKEHTEINCKNIVLATGSIPKVSLLTADSYFSDGDYCASFNFNHLAKQIFSKQSNDKIHKKYFPKIAIVGASASALEIIYYIANLKGSESLVEKIYVISNSGRLIHGLTAFDFCETATPSYVLGRRSSDIYRQTALSSRSRLEIIKGRLTTINQQNSEFMVSFKKEINSTEEFSLSADIVINCTGGGSIDNTNSTLLKHLRDKFPVAPERRGFSVNENNQIIGYPGFFVVGPLLNRYELRQVENIPSVFQEGMIVGNALNKIIFESKNKTSVEVSL